MHTKVLKIPFVRCVALFGALLTMLNTLAQAVSSGRTPSIYAFNHTGAATINLGETLYLNRPVGDSTKLTLTPGIGYVTGTTWANTSRIQFVVPPAATYCGLADLTPDANFTTTAKAVNGTLVIEVTSGGNLSASAQGTLVFDISATGAVSAP